MSLEYAVDLISPSISGFQLGVLQDELTAARSHPVCAALPEWFPDSTTMFQYAVDASMEEELDADILSVTQVAVCRRLRSNCRWKWTNKLQKFSYIGEAELEAIVWAVRDAVEQLGGKVSSVLTIVRFAF